MTVLTFPTNPILGQQYAAPNGIQYVFDGVKWIVETTSSSSAAVTNSVQDRVAPMFVTGDHTGITFTYNAATNVMSAEVAGSTFNGDYDDLINKPTLFVGPGSATDNAIVRFDGTTGTLAQNSLVTVSDTGAIVAPQVGSVIPFYFANQAAFPSAGTYHGAVAHSHSDGKMYFAHGGVWNALANASELFSGNYDNLSNRPTIPPAYTLPTASTTVLGGVKVDGTTVTITDGVISSVGGGSGGGGDANIWVQTFESEDGAPTDVVGIAISVEYDSAGNVISLFTHSNAVGNNYYSVGKYTTTGTKIWTARFADGFDTDGWGLAVDNNSNSIYVAGQTTPETGYSVSTLTKLDSSDGTIEWSKTYDFGFASQSAVVDVDSDGNPIMVGYASNGNDNYITTTKVAAADGTIIWSRALDGQNDEEAYGMAVGPTGEVVAVGYMESFGVQDAAATLYTEPASNPLWTVGGSIISLDGVTADYSFTDGVPTFTNVVDTVGGRSVDDVIITVLGGNLGGVTGVDDMVVKVATLAANDTDNRMLVVKYAANGTIAWQKAIQFDAGFDCRGADADIDSDGNIYVTGSYRYSFESGTTSALSILKLDSTGVKQWSRRVTGNCDTFGVSVVVGADDKLYLSAMTGNNNDANNAYTWVAAKYGINGTVEWQRLIDNTTGWSFTGDIFLGDGGGSNIAVKQDYVVLAGGFGDLINSGVPHATLVQVAATGDVFSVGDWDFTAASFSGVLNSSASDITVVNAGKTDTDNVSNINVSTVTLQFDSSAFLIGTLYSAGDSSDRLVNGAHEVVLGASGTVTLPAGGTITEGYVTSNPTIQLTPATPDVASQKLVIKGGGSYDYTDNGININYYTNTAIVGDTLTFYINSPTYAGQTLYWWIYPEGANISDPGSGTVVLDGNSGTISFELDSDDNEFTLRVSPEANNYDPASLGVESGLINPDAPTFDFEHHLHLTTGNLAETSIFLGTDDHNVRTTTDGNIQITTPNTSNNVWNFDVAGDLNLPDNGGIVFDRNNTTIRVGMGFHIASGEGISLDAIDQNAILTLSGAGNGPVNQTYNKTNNTLYTGNDNSSVTVENLGGTWFVFIDGDAKYTSNDLIGWALSTGPGPVPVGVLSNGYKSWVFSPTGNLTFPDGTTNSGDTVISTSTYNIQSIGNTLIQTSANAGAKTWTFGTNGSLTFPDTTVQTTAWAGGRVVAVPTASIGAAGDKQGDLAFNNSYIYYCTQNFTPSSYSSTIVLTYSGTYPTIVKGSIPQPQAGWELIHDGNTYILDANATEGNPGEWSLSLSSSISVTIGDSVTIGPASVPNIWKRVAWSGDTW